MTIATPRRRFPLPDPGAPARLVAAAAAAVALAFAAPATAADGELDPGFDGDGLWIAANGNSHSFTRAAPAPDGALVVYGTRYDGSVHRFHWRRIDATGVGPLCSFLPANASQLRLPGIAFDYAGRLLLAGSLEVGTADPVVGVLRYLYPDCTLDPDFDGGGFATHAIGQPGLELAAVAGVETARWLELGFFRNRILVAFTAADASFAYSAHLMRLFADGTLDTAFGGGDGVADLGLDRYASAFARAHDGRFLVAGMTIDGINQSRGFVAKLDRDAAADPAFGTAGEAIVDLPGTADERFRGLAVGPDGRLALFGATDGSGAAVEDAAVAVLRANGTLDASFSGDGWTTWARSGAERTDFRGAAFDGKGRLLATGRTSDPADASDDEGFALRFGRFGGVDGGFGAAGQVYFAIDDVPQGEDMGTAAAVAADGRLWIAGSTQVEVAPGDTDYRPFAALLTNALIFADGFERASTANW